MLLAEYVLHNQHQLSSALFFATLETRRKLDCVNFEKDLWDRYWGRAGQLLTNFFPVPSNSPRILCER